MEKARAARLEHCSEFTDKPRRSGHQLTPCRKLSARRLPYLEEEAVNSGSLPGAAYVASKKRRSLISARRESIQQ